MGILNNKIHISNATNQDIWVLVTPNKDWMTGDFAFDLAKTMYSGGFNLAKLGASMPATLKNLKDFYDLICFVKKVYSLSLGKVSKVTKAVAAGEASKQYYDTIELIKKSAIKIAPGENKEVNNKLIVASVCHLFNRFFAMTGVGLTAAKEVAKRVAGSELDKYPVLKEVVADEPGLLDTVLGILSLLNPSKFLSVFDFIADMTVMVVSDDFSRNAIFDCNSDHSWIVKDNTIVRAKHGKLWEEDSNAGWKVYAGAKGTALLAGEYLEAGEAIAFQTVLIENLPKTVQVERYEERYENKNSEDGFFAAMGKFFSGGWRKANMNRLRNNATTKAKTTHKIIENVVTMVQTLTKAQYILYYDFNGNLVLYKNSGDKPTAVWETGTQGRNTWRVYAQDDGNLCVYSADGVCEWAWWQSPPASAKGNYYKLDINSGELIRVDENETIQETMKDNNHWLKK